MQNKTRRPLTDLQARQAARRIAAAASRITDARHQGPKEVIDAVRACLMSAVKVNPDRSVIDAYAEASLEVVTKLHKREGAGRDVR